MKLSEDLIKRVNRITEPSATVPMHYRNNDLMVRTDGEGRPVQLFIGKADEQGRIRGDRYTRTIVKDREGKVIKDYWERKGRATP